MFVRYTTAPAGLDLVSTWGVPVAVDDRGRVVRRCLADGMTFERQEFRWRGHPVLTEGEYRRLVGENLIREYQGV